MLKFINLKKLTAKTLIGILMVGGLMTSVGTKKATASNGVQGIEIYYKDSAIQCGDDPTQGDVKIDVYNQTNDTLLTTMSKGQTFTTTEVDSIEDLYLRYRVFGLTCLTDGGVRGQRDTKILGSSDTIPTVIGYNGQASISDMLADLNDSYEKLYLVELGNTSGPGYDLQDVVLVIDNNPESLVDAQSDEDEVIPVLWGIDEDDGQLFAMEDYTDSSTMIDYGKLKWNDNGVIKNVGKDMEAMTIDENGDMYIALDSRRFTGGGNGASLLRFNIQNATTSGDNVAQVLGNIGIDFDRGSDNVTGLSINPLTGDLVAVLNDYGYNSNNEKRNLVDRLYVISKADGSLVREIGKIRGLDEKSHTAEDIEHAPDGSLYVTDNHDDHTYKVDSLTGAIIEVVDNNQEDGLGSSSVKFEGLGWDFANNRLIGFDDNDESLAKLTLENGNNYEYYDTTSLGLTDVEGVDFVPTITGVPTALLDTDTDGDGIIDSVEGVEDSDGDGIPNFRDEDSDGDGINDSVEGTEDPDGDEVENYLDEDSDGDGIPDADEGSLDNDGDQVENYLDEDSDGDGINDADEGIEDPDEDGTGNYLDLDSDGDGIPDENEQLSDSNDPGKDPDVGSDPNPNVDGDPDPNYLDLDSDGDGFEDDIDPEPYIPTYAD